MTNFDRDPTFDHDSPYENSTGGNKSTYNNNEQNNSDYIQTSLKQSNLDRNIRRRVSYDEDLLEKVIHPRRSSGPDRVMSRMSDKERSRYPHTKPLRRGGNQSPGTYRGQRMTYAELITEAINSSIDRSLTLQDIYTWMTE